MAAEGADKTPSRLVLLVQGRPGYLNLCQLLSRGWLHNAASGHATLEWSWLAEHGDGLIALSGADSGAIVSRTRAMAMKYTVKSTPASTHSRSPVSRAGSTRNERPIRSAAPAVASSSATPCIRVGHARAIRNP